MVFYARLHRSRTFYLPSGITVSLLTGSHISSPLDFKHSLHGLSVDNFGRCLQVSHIFNDILLYSLVFLYESVGHFRITFTNPIALTNRSIIQTFCQNALSTPLCFKTIVCLCGCISFCRFSIVWFGRILVISIHPLFRPHQHVAVTVSLCAFEEISTSTTDVSNHRFLEAYTISITWSFCQWTEYMFSLC